MFAKLFEHPVVGQVLLKIQTNQDGSPDVRWYAQPAGMGVCSMAIIYENTPEAWDFANKFFNEADEEEVNEACRIILQMVQLDQYPTKSAFNPMLH